ncbi:MULTISPECIES: LexA family protein [Pseudomonas syringae group]|uniref:LexA family protein n=1 Tax=Pseudomonas syringae group TaxID=136849 RepID=UPI000EFF24EC|nr:S24 family peptidase [Pseudomonas savastanoi]
MVDKSIIRADFSKRLHEALDDAGVRTRGRGVDIHRSLGTHRVYKTTQAISKWLNGEAVPESDSMAALASWLNVRREWLEYGVPPKESGEWNDSRNAPDINVAAPHKRFGKVPVISWVQAGIWSETVVNSDLYSADEWLSCPTAIGRNGYALKVLGDSMTNPGPGRSYPAGCIIFVDPDAQVTTGDRVIARLPRTNEATFKVLVEDAGRQFLRPINPQYPIIEITEETHICGKVVGAFISE